MNMKSSYTQNIKVKQKDQGTQKTDFVDRKSLFNTKIAEGDEAVLLIVFWNKLCIVLFIGANFFKLLVDREKCLANELHEKIQMIPDKHLFSSSRNLNFR